MRIPTTLLIILPALALNFSTTALTAETIPGRWSAEQANEWYKEQPFLVGANFTPSNAINQLEFWQADTFDPETIDRELGWAAAIGMNSMRVYLHDLVWAQDGKGYLERIDQYLAIADKHGIGTMFVLCDSVWNPHPKLGKQPEPVPHVHNSGWVQSPHIEILRDPKKHKTLESYFRGIINRYKDDPRVVVWDLYNEPGNVNKDDEMTIEEKEALCLMLLRKMFMWARDIAPSQPLTAGVWNPSRAWTGPNATELNTFMLENSDVISFHCYQSYERTVEKVGSLKPYGRPILCTEYVARPRNSFETHLPYFKDNKIAAYNWGLVAGKIQTQYPWSSWRKTFTAEPEVWHHDIFRPDGRPFRQAETDLIKKLTADEQ